jgi:hypothetical protein
LLPPVRRGTVAGVIRALVLALSVASNSAEAAEASATTPATAVTTQPRQAEEIPAWLLWRDYVKVAPPQGDGKALFIAAAATFGVGAVIQLSDLALNDNSMSGVTERLFIGPAMILAPIGGALRGRYDAYMDTALGRRTRPTKGMIAAGLTLAAVGAIGGVTNEVLWWRCMVGETGPYRQVAPDPDLFTPGSEPCPFSAARLALDGSAMMVSSGLGMALWGLRYRRDMRAYERAVIAAVPTMNSHHFGLALWGRF